MKSQISYQIDGVTFTSVPHSQFIQTSLLAMDGSFSMDQGMMGEFTEGMGEVEVKDPLMSSWMFVGGITTVVLAISITVGILLAKSKIKKGFELYED